MRIKYYAPFAIQTGYAVAAQDYLLALHRAGVELQIVPLVDADTDALPERFRELLPLVEHEIKDPTHVIVHGAPAYLHEFVTGDLDPGRNVKRVAVTTWETDSAPNWIGERLMRHFDRVITPSRWSAATLGCNAHVVPHCFDADWWYADAGTKVKEPYTFYSILTWDERKNPIGLLKAYLAEFRAADPVQLVIVCSPRGVWEADFVDLCRSSGIRDLDLPAVEFLSDLSDTELRTLHDQAHCYVTLSRAEGWGLGAFEASFMGNLVIAPSYGGLGEATDLGWCKRVSWSCRPVITPEPKLRVPVRVGGLDIAAVDGPPPELTAEQQWCEPSIAEARAAMRSAVEGRIERDVPLWRTLIEHKKAFGYEAVAQQFIEAIR